MLRSWALLLKIQWKLQSILGGNPMFFSSSVYIQILLFFLKAHIAYQSSTGTDHVWGSLVRLSWAKGNCALGVYSEWHSPEGFDQNSFFQIISSNSVGRIGWVYHPMDEFIMALSLFGFLSTAKYIFPVQDSNTLRKQNC